ncbi:MAG: ABC transporter permease [Bacilli bacterium]|nr:ABC transporter permease [Bacilli bacterium]MBN2877489.1 ABC transporter permease [Bacilli bacterium]
MKASRVWVLVKGELLRLNKYNIFAISILVAIIWGVMLYFVNSTILATLLPMVLLVDASMMSIMYIGSVMFFEKSEFTISTMLVTPSTNAELVLSKVLANTIHNLFSSVLIIIAFVLLKDVKLNYFLIFVGIVVTTTFFTIFGYYMAYFQKNFTGMLVNIMIFAFALLIPSLLYEVHVITADWFQYVLVINPFQAGAELIGGGFKDYVFEWQYYFSLAYLLIGTVLVYRFLVLPKFHDYSIRQSGV